MGSKYDIGVDIGAVSVNLAVIPTSEKGLTPFLQLPSDVPFFVLSMPGLPDILLSDYIRHQGDPSDVLNNLMTQLNSIISNDQIRSLSFTGVGGKTFVNSDELQYINEFRATGQGTGWLYPHVKTIFEMGGEHGKYIQIQMNGGQEVQIVDYETNGDCAAGTGSFFDQQVERLHFHIEEVGDIVRKAKRSAIIAGRCSVFAKTDMIHAQQCGFTPEEILKGLCEAVVRNFKGTITKGKEIHEQVALVGGMAANQGIVRAFQDLFQLNDQQFIVSKAHAWVGAIGAARNAQMKEEIITGTSISLKGLSKQSIRYPVTKSLSMKKVRLLRDQVKPILTDEDQTIDAYLGIDIGSVSTNLALLNPNGELIHGIYTSTKGRPIEVVKEALQEIREKFKQKINIHGVGTTGSGRELIGLLVGADTIKDEITAHKTGAMHISNTYLNTSVDTIFEIGGQDSKFISIRDGIVVDFALNEACAAGTGSFLEEQAKQLNIEIKDQFAQLAFQGDKSLRLGERCTVFMEKELNPYLHHGISRQEITSGLALSVVQNYLNRVVKKRPIGDVIFFQGGTAYNDAVAAAFATILDKEIIIPPFNGIMGAIGAALLAKEKHQNKVYSNSSFRSWNLDAIQWQLREFVCKGCTNQCTIQEFRIGNEKSYWGDKCSDRYRKRAKSDVKAKIPDIVRQREQLILQYYVTIDHHKDIIPRKRVGIPRSLYFHDRLVFWRTYLEALGFETVLSNETNSAIVHEGLEATVAEPCFPLQVAHGHIKHLQDQSLDFIFFPHIVNEESPKGYPASYICPWGQTISLVANHSPALKHRDIPLINPTVHFEFGFDIVLKDLISELGAFGLKTSVHRNALELAYEAQGRFIQTLNSKAMPAIDDLVKNGWPSVILLGRPYNLYDTGLNLNLPSKLRDLYGVNALPMDLLPIDDVDITKVHDHMYWNYGRRILQAALWSKRYSNMHLIYLSNFKCGPDSYIRHFVEEASGEPFLFLQLDSHSNDAGVLTRIEAYLESKGML